MTGRGILDHGLTDLPIAVCDTETTGLYPGGDRVIEIAIVRCEPNSEPKLVLDTLLNPQRSVTATEIHGITDADVADAPTFDQVAPVVLDALNRSIFASYNVYFDARFIRQELSRIGFAAFPPHLCLMYLRPMLGLGRKCSLRDACHHTGISNQFAHHAAGDAFAAAALWKNYLETCKQAGIRTFAQLAALRSYKFTESFDDALLDEASRLTVAQFTSKSRSQSAVKRTPLPVTDRQFLLSAYWEALTAALSDLDVTAHEVFYLRAKQKVLNLTSDELRWLHARAFSGVLADMCQDRAITTDEARTLSDLAGALRELGWVPGDCP